MKHLVHLDDCILFSSCLKRVVEHHFKNITYLQFAKADHALHFVKEGRGKNTPADLLITDLSHPGLNGLAFAKSVRESERKTGISKTPILLLTSEMKSPVIDKAINEGIINGYFKKTVPYEKLLQYIERVCKL